MAQRKKKSSSPAKTGQTSEPNVQLYGQWQGINTELNPLDFEMVGDEHAQTDLLPQYFLVQNNLVRESNGSVATREPLKTVTASTLASGHSDLDDPDGPWWYATYTVVIRGELYLCRSTLYAWAEITNHTTYAGRSVIIYRQINSPVGNWTILLQKNVSEKTDIVQWTEIFHYGNRLICLGKTALGTGDFYASDSIDGAGQAPFIHNWNEILPPSSDQYIYPIGSYSADLDRPTGWKDSFDFIGDARPVLTPMGKLKGNNVYAKDTANKANPNYIASSKAACRITVKFCYTNEVGQTTASGTSTIYTDKTPVEWTAGSYLRVSVPRVFADGGTYNPDFQKLNTYDIEKDYNDTCVFTPPDDARGVDIYYTINDATTYAFMGHVNIGLPHEPDSPPEDDPYGAYAYRYFWKFDWYGGEADTSIWTHSPLDEPKENTTAGVGAMYGTEKDGRLFFWGDPTKQDRLYIGGNPGNEISVSRGLGGGWLDHGGPQHGDILRSVQRFETYNGATIITCLFDNVNTGSTQRANVIDTNIQFTSEIATKAWMFEDVEGVAGCNSYHGAGVFYDGMYYTTRDGLGLTTKAMESQNQLRTDYVSDVIHNIWNTAFANIQHNTWVCAIKDVIYLSFGSYRPLGNTWDPLIFCYDIKAKAWYTFTAEGITGDIVGLFHVDWEGFTEGLGIATATGVYMFPLWPVTHVKTGGTVPSKIITGEIGRSSPLSGHTYVSQLEFRFQEFIGSIDITLYGVDYYGRNITVKKNIRHGDYQTNLKEYMRVDQILESYRLVIEGTARYRLTHYAVKQYIQSMQVGQVWGFDDEVRQAMNGTESAIHHYIDSYNSLKESLIP
jgi:hypothetical protein